MPYNSTEIMMISVTGLLKHVDSLNVLAVILHNNVAGAQVEESANQVLGLEEWSKHIHELFFALFGVDEFFIFCDNLVALGESILAILLAHLSSELFEVTGVEVDHVLVRAETF
jgi:hypothetical protein